MFTKVKFPFLLLLMFLATDAALPAYAETIVWKKVGGLSIPLEYSRCRHDSDCMVIKDVCSRWRWHPINVINKHAVEDVYNSAEVIACMSVSYAKPLVGCVDEMCVFIPDKNNCLLYAGSSCALLCSTKDVHGACSLPEEK
jgi:hypothetical protein